MNTKANNSKILVVEDESLVALDITQALTEYGYQPLGPISSGEEALKQIEKEKPDLVLLDINLAGAMDGIAVAQTLSKTTTPVIFLTGNSDEEMLRRAVQTRPHGYLLKPFDTVELHGAIEIALGRSTRGAPQVTEQEPGDQEELEDIYSTVIDEKEATQRLLSLSKAFEKLPPETVQGLASIARLRAFEGGELIASAGEEHRSGFIVVNGRVGVSLITSNGRELVVELLAPGDPYGLICGIEFSPNTLVRAQTPSKALIFPERALRQLFNEDAALARLIATEAAQRLQRSYQLARSLAYSKVEDRIRATLLALLSNFGRTGDQQTVRLYLTRRELADLTGTTPETAIRVTKSLERQGMLDLSRPGIIKILKPEELQPDGD